MKLLKKLLILTVVCCIVSGCSALDKMLPELTTKEKEFCTSAINYFVENANSLNGENLKMFTTDAELIFTHEAALEEYGSKLDKATKNAYWATVIVNDLLPKDYELTDVQLKKMKIDIVEDSMKGFLDSTAYVDAVMSFSDDETPSKKIQFCMFAESGMGGGFVPKILYIKFLE